MSHLTVWLLLPTEQRIKAFPEFTKIAGNYVSSKMSGIACLLVL